MTRDDLLGLLSHDNVQAFLRVLRAGESSQDDSAYSVMFGGGHFESFEEHPNVKNTRTLGGKPVTSTAAGAYQFLFSTWREVAQQYGLNDFGSTNQDIGAVALIHRRKALDDVLAGRFDAAISKCNREWASLPGSPYGQPTLTLAKAREVYLAHGGRIAGETARPAAPAPTVTEKPMAAPLIPIFTALLPIIKDIIPALGSLFGSGSESQQRNVAAATLVTDALTKATNSPNLQAAVEAMQSDPAVAAAARAAVTDILPSLVEAGGGGIDGARKASMNADAPPFWRQHSFVFLVVSMPLVYMLAVSVLFGIGGVDWAVEVRVMVATGLIGLLGAASAFFWGSSLGSQKKDSVIGGRP